jgi:hypothetical protein
VAAIDFTLPTVQAYLATAFPEPLLNKTNITVLIPYLDDDVFRPVALLDSYRSLGLATCLPFVRDP